MGVKDYKSIILILIALLAISVCLNVVCIRKSSMPPKEMTVVGSFSALPPSTPSIESQLYFTLDHDGKYLIYRQFEILDSGSYQVEERKLSLYGKTNIVGYYDGSDEIVFFDSMNNKILCFLRYSNLPEYINVKVE